MTRPHILFDAFALYLGWCLSIGSLKYIHHFGLDPFSGEHWILQASLTHSISDELFVLSFVSVLDALNSCSWGLTPRRLCGGQDRL